MEEEANSWIRRTKFSHTICHRLDTATLVSIPFTLESNQMGGVNSRHEKVLVNPTSGSIGTPIQTNPTTNKHRAVSPHPQITLSDTFKEARSDRKRFSTPHPRGKEEVVVERKPSRKNSSKSRSSRTTSPLKHFSFGKFHDHGIKSKKDTSWTKFFDHGGGRVTAVGSSDELTVDLSKLMIGYRFAHGAHSRLYHGIYEDKRVAIKLIRPPDDEENGVLGAQLENQFNREVRLLSRLHHPNVIKFIAAGIQAPVFCIVTEYLSEGSLRAYLHRLEDKTLKQSLPLQELIKMALDIARGMEYIHSQGVIHRDLKPENILISDDFQLKIADFGIGCEESHCDSLADDPGTYRWMAPEMIKRKSYGRKVDVYGFGLILWEMVSGAIPYEDMTPIQAAFAVVNKNMRPPIPVNCPPAMKALIEQCWSTHPDKRPEFWQVVKVLEQFETSLARDGTLNLVQSPTCQDHKKGLRRWIKKLGPVHHQHTCASTSTSTSTSTSSFSSMPKPKFS